MTSEVTVSTMYLDAVVQVLEQLLHEVEDDAAPVDAQAVIEETHEYLRGATDAQQEEVAVPAMEEEPAVEGAEA